MADVFTSHRNTTEDKRVRGCAELLEVLRGSQGSSSTSGLFSVFSTGILYSMPWETRSSDKQTLFSVFSVRKTVFYISISLEQHSSPLTVTHDQTPLVATQSITAIIPRPCSTTGTCPSSKPHSDHDHDHDHDHGPCTSSPSLVIGTKNIWMDGWKITHGLADSSKMPELHSKYFVPSHEFQPIKVLKGSVIWTLRGLIPDHII